jgi:hypothetical protein
VVCKEEEKVRPEPRDVIWYEMRLLLFTTGLKGKWHAWKQCGAILEYDAKYGAENSKSERERERERETK